MVGRIVLLRFISLLAVAAVIFAPAPTLADESVPRTSKDASESLAAQMLTPTFDEGVVRTEGRFSILQLVKRRPSDTTYAIVPVLTVVALVLVAAVCRWRSDTRQERIVTTLIASRAPPVSP